MPGTLTHFTSETARAAQRKGLETKRARAIAQRAAAADVIGAVRTLADTLSRDELAPMAFSVAAYVMGAVLNGTIPVRNGAEAADLLRALVDIGRLESGDAQRTVAVAHLSGPALAARLRELQTSAAVSAAADDQLGHEGSSPPAQPDGP